MPFLRIMRSFMCVFGAMVSDFRYCGVEISGRLVDNDGLLSGRSVVYYTDFSKNCTVGSSVNSSI